MICNDVWTQVRSIYRCIEISHPQRTPRFPHALLRHHQSSNLSLCAVVDALWRAGGHGCVRISRKVLKPPASRRHNVHALDTVPPTGLCAIAPATVATLVVGARSRELVRAAQRIAALVRCLEASSCSDHCLEFSLGSSQLGLQSLHGSLSSGLPILSSFLCTSSLHCLCLVRCRCLSHRTQRL